MTAEQLGFVMETIIDEGALDVYFTNIMMKKNRTAVMMTILCNPCDKEKFSKLLLKSTSTFGIRYTDMDRDVLERKFQQVVTPWGMVNCKLGILDGKIVKCAPEYEDCKALAKAKGMNVIDIYNMVISKYMESQNTQNIL